MEIKAIFAVRDYKKISSRPQGNAILEELFHFEKILFVELMLKLNRVYDIYLVNKVFFFFYFANI